jgi:hypothetical protein
VRLCGLIEPGEALPQALQTARLLLEKLLEEGVPRSRSVRYGELF